MSTYIIAFIVLLQLDFLQYELSHFKLSNITNDSRSPVQH